MAGLIDRFINLLPELGAKKIQKQLSKDAERIIFSDPQEFRDEFQRRLRELLGSDSGVSYKYREFGPGEEISSELMNYIFEILEDDLDNLFSQANLLLSLSGQRPELIERQLLNPLRVAINEAAQQIEVLELLKGTENGLQKAFVQTSETQGERVALGTDDARVALVDPKFNERVSLENTMPFSLVSGGLTLPLINQSRLTGLNVDEVTNDSLIGSQLAQAGATLPSTPGVKETQGELSNITDGRVGTYWIKNLFTEPDEYSSARVTVEVTVAQRERTVNYIEIEPVSSFAQELEAIFYVDDTDVVQELTVASLPIKLEGKTLVSFKDIKAKKIAVVLKQKSKGRAIRDRRVYDKFSFGLDNIITGKKEYAQTGLFASKTLELDKISTLYLRASEALTVLTKEGQDLETDDSPLPTVEYWACLRDERQGGRSESVRHIPIMPISTTLHKERLSIDREGKAKLMFMTKSPSFSLKRNGTLLIEDDDYTLIGADGLSADRPYVQVRGGFSQDDSYIAEYTVSYSEADSPRPFRDNEETIQYNKNGTIIVNRASEAVVNKSKCNLIIIMRGTGDSLVTSVVNEVAFGVG